MIVIEGTHREETSTHLHSNDVKIPILVKGLRGTKYRLDQ